MFRKAQDAQALRAGLLNHLLGRTAHNMGMKVSSDQHMLFPREQNNARRQFLPCYFLL
jgi:hypothetical protein